MKKQEIKKGEIIIYKSPQGPEIQVKLEEDSVWLRQDEIAKLYGKERSVITKHINKIFSDKEIDKKSNVHFLHIANSDRPVAFYSLDVILAVGYRTNSSRAVDFRRWATKILKNYLIKGYAINQKRLLQVEEQLKDLQETISFLQEKSKDQLLIGQEQELLNLLSSYSKTLLLLEQYDKGKLALVGKAKGEYKLQYEEAVKVIEHIKTQLVTKKEAGVFFGVENSEKLKSIFGNIYQTFGGKELYSSLEEKAAHLLYFIIKDHPFVDGNKRIGSFLFIYFLDKNNYLLRETGEKKINDNALTILALLIAVSDPKEKDKLIKIVTNLLAV
ncbi:MAG TPA: virulence protein RhuM/Fic/DOC family protein [Ignavibacteria bacterium]